MVYTNLTALKKKSLGERNTGKLETMPDQAVSPQELLRRYATGQPLGFKNATPVYDDDEDNPVPEFYKMNKLDRLHDLQESSDNLMEKRSDFDAYQRQQKQKQAEKSAEKENAKKTLKTENSEQSGETSV